MSCNGTGVYFVLLVMASYIPAASSTISDITSFSTGSDKYFSPSHVLFLFFLPLPHRAHDCTLINHADTCIHSGSYFYTTCNGLFSMSVAINKPLF